jgi:hypothetical protein
MSWQLIKHWVGTDIHAGQGRLVVPVPAGRFGHLPMSLLLRWRNENRGLA